MCYTMWHRTMEARLLAATVLFTGLTSIIADPVESLPQQFKSPAEKLTAMFTNTPQQIHLSLGKNPNDIIIMWSSKRDEKGYVEYGQDPKTLTSVPAYGAELKMYHEGTAKYLHRAELLDLTPGAQYTYRIVSEDSGSKSAALSFKVPHNNPNWGHKFLVFADMGLLTKSLRHIVHEVLEGDYDVVFHIGDFAYNLHREGGRYGDDFMNIIDNFTARVPYLTAPGDHESIAGAYNHDKEESYYHYRYRFSMPGAPWPMTHDSLWYSIDIGHTHFISINTDLFVRHSRLNRLQMEWLTKDLKAANANRKAHPWIIVMGHMPMYCTRSVMSQDCHEDESPMRGQVEDLFFEQGVDLYLSGHKHCYERTWPMYLGRTFQTDTIDPIAPIYIISGSLGYEYLVDHQLSKPYWLAFASSDRQKELVGRLNVVNETLLIWSVYTVLSGEEVENVPIIQRHHGSFGTAGPVAFERISKRAQNLPPEPLNIIDAPYDSGPRTAVLYSVVLLLFVLLIVLLRSAKFRKVFRMRK